MQSALRRLIHVFMVLVAIGCSFSARAAYQITTVDYPDAAAQTQLFGINNSGQIVGQALYADGSSLSFTYDFRKGGFTTLPNVPDVSFFLGINERGTVVGSVSDAAFTYEHGVILDKKGNATTLNHPAPLTNTQARAIGPSGLVTGFAYNADFTMTAGFIYDPKRNTFIDILPNSEDITIAQGINGRGDVVGNFSTFTDDQAFLRDSGGVITMFNVNGLPTRARGISDSGQITGFYDTGSSLEGFVGTLSGGFVTLSVPGALATIAQAIDNAGTVVGYYFDADANLHGFIATPLPPKGK